MRLFEEHFRRRLPPELFDEHVARAARVAEALGERFEPECMAGQTAGWDAIVTLATTVLLDINEGSVTKPVRRRGPRANTQLTERELDVLAQLVAGRTNQQIGEQLRISPKTVMHHTMSVYRKLSVRGRAEAVAHAIRTGLVDA